ncbi:helix-turn-helix domain-containing protein [Ruminococcus sp.]|uniref:helix-turn-helix domain-containing protein n=1 Tax=Ruminococcus sp. TaxID=41978 RepID=UPI00338D65F1
MSKKLSSAQCGIYEKNTSDSINAICGLCDFDDHSYFSKAFKEAYGCSPRDFRK